jgi:hypothetical protein
MQIEHVKNKENPAEIFFVYVTENESAILIKSIADQLSRGSNGNSGRLELKDDEGKKVFSVCVLNDKEYLYGLKREKIEPKFLNLIEKGIIEEGYYHLDEWQNFFCKAIEDKKIERERLGDDSFLIDSKRRKFDIKINVAAIRANELSFIIEKHKRVR